MIALPPCAVPAGHRVEIRLSKAEADAWAKRCHAKRIHVTAPTWTAHGPKVRL